MASATDEDVDDIDDASSVGVYEEEDVDELEEYRKAEKVIQQRAAVAEEEEFFRKRFGGARQKEVAAADVDKLDRDRPRNTENDAADDVDPELAANMQESIEIFSAQFVDKLGYMPDGACSSSDYRIHPSCKAMLRNLLRISQKEMYPFPIRTYLSKAKIIQRDLVHITVQSANAAADNEDSQDIFNYTLRLMLYLTTPLDDRLQKELADHGANEVEALRMEMQSLFAQVKDELADEQFYSALRVKLEALVRKPKDDWDDDDDLNFTRLLKLLSYILRMPSSLPSLHANVVVSSLSSHDRIVVAMHKSRLDALIMYLAAAKEFLDTAMDSLEIFYYMLLPYDAELIARCVKPGTEQPKPAESHASFKTQPNSADQIFANVLHEQKIEHFQAQKRAQVLSRYQGCVEVRSLKSSHDADKSILTNRPIADILHNRVDATFSTAAARKPQRRALKEAQPPAAQIVTLIIDTRVCWTVKLICEQILKTSYNKLVKRAHDLLTASILSDERHAMFIWALQYFVKYNVAFCSAGLGTSSGDDENRNKFRVELVSQAISMHIIQQLHTYITACYERITSTDRLKSDVWLQRVHVAIKAFRDMLYAMMALQSSGDAQLVSAAKALENHIFYVPEYRDLCLNMLHAIEPHRLPLPILQCVVETIHVFLRLLEGYIWAERGHFVAVDQRRRRRRNAKKLKKSKKVTENETNGEKSDDVSGFINDEHDDDEDEDDDADAQMNEAEFDFNQFLRKFATFSSLKPYFIVLKTYRENTLLVNHAIVKMFHRLMFEAKLPAVLYKATLFMTFQKILNDPFLDAGGAGGFAATMSGKKRPLNDEAAKTETAKKNETFSADESAGQLKEMIRLILRGFFISVTPKKILALLIPLDLGQAESVEGVLAVEKPKNE